MKKENRKKYISDARLTARPMLTPRGQPTRPLSNVNSKSDDFLLCRQQLLDILRIRRTLILISAFSIIPKAPSMSWSYAGFGVSLTADLHLLCPSTLKLFQHNRRLHASCVGIHNRILRSIIFVFFLQFSIFNFLINNWIFLYVGINVMNGFEYWRKIIKLAYQAIIERKQNLSNCFSCL